MGWKVSPQAVHNCLNQYWTEQSLSSEYGDTLREVLRETIDHTAAVEASGSSLLEFPALCCQAIDDRAIEGIVQVTAMWLLYYAAACRLDGIADRASLVNPSVGIAANVAAGLIVSAEDLLRELPDVAVRLSIQAMFARSVLAMCNGQHLILTGANSSLQTCWHLAELRSGGFFAAAAWSGARLATSDEKQLAQIELYGRELGILLQVGDDWKDLWVRAGQPSDLAAGTHPTLPVAYAMTVLPENDRDKLCDLLRRAPSDSEAEEQGRRQILASGAAVYLAVEVEQRKRRARQALINAASSLPACTMLLTILEEIAARCII